MVNRKRGETEIQHSIDRSTDETSKAQKGPVVIVIESPPRQFVMHFDAVSHHLAKWLNHRHDQQQHDDHILQFST